MRRVFILLLLAVTLAVPVRAEEITAPPAPDAAQELLPAQTKSFGEDLWTVVKNALKVLQPKLTQAAGVCLSLIAVALLISLAQNTGAQTSQVISFLGTLAVSGLLLYRSNIFVQMGLDTVEQLSEYGKLLLPAMTAAMAAQGGMTSSVALYGGTVVFNTLLTTAIGKLLIPLVYGFMALAVAGSALGKEPLGKLKDFLKWLITWFLKIVLYVFTGYLGITGVVSGSADAAALRATKLTISGMVPVVGGILSDASEAVLVGAGVVKSAVGVYGLLTVLAIWISPFLELGVQYLLLKATGALCGTFGAKKLSDFILDFSSVMGLLLAMTGTVCFLHLISTVCFMKGVG